MTGDIGPFEIDMKYIIEENGLDALDTVWLKEHHRSLAFSMAGAKVSMQQVAEHFGLWEDFRAHIRKKILAEWKLLVDEYGINALKFKWLEKNKLIKVLRRGERNGVTLNDAIAELDQDGKLKEERSRVSRNGGVLWNKTLFDETAQEIVDRFGCIPPKTFLDGNGYGGFGFQIAKYGPNIEDIRKRLNVQNVCLVDISGQRHDSLPEVCFFNFCHARGIIITIGERYSDEFAKRYDRAFAIYDGHFVATQNQYSGQRISLEIFGGGSQRDVEGRERYAQTRAFKEDFHKDDPNFLGVEYQDCYKEATIKKVLAPYIGDPEVIYEHPLIKVPTVSLSIVDDVLRECKTLCDQLPEGHQVLPSVDWFARRGSYADRAVYDWEPKSWGRLIGRLNQIGYPAIRAALGQAPKQHEHLDKEKLLLAFEKLTANFDRTASAVKRQLEKKKDRNSEDEVWLFEAKYLDRRWREVFDIKQTLPNIHAAIQELRDELGQRSS